MTIGMKENINGGGTFVEQLNSAIRENPVSAGLVGLGILWMFFGNGKIASLSSALPSATRYVNDEVRSASEGLSAAAAGMVGKVGQAVQHASESVKSGAKEAGASITSAKFDASRTATEYGIEIKNSVQKNFASTLEEQPLLLGMIGVGIGAGIASIFSSTGIEQEIAGAAAAKVKDQFRDFASQASDRAEKVFGDVKREATEQGITSASASEGLNNVVDKVRATTAAAKESILTSSP